jgi:hypothetical protein
MLTNHLWPRKLALIALGLLIPLAGCANLTAIREFAGISSDAAGYRRVVDDYVTGPDRRARYVSPCPDCQRQHDEKKRQEPLLLLEQDVVQAYMEALGELAADDLVDYSEEYDALGAAAQNAKLIAADKAEAAATLAKLLTKAATDHWRQRQLKEIITRANPPLQIVLDGLRTVMNAFEVDLSGEKEHARNYYGSLVLAAGDKPCARCSEPAVAGLKEWQELRFAEIEERHQAVVHYRAIIAKIAEAHQKLFDERDDLANKDTLRQIKAYARDLKKAHKALQELRG